ncbi:MAG: hypothetical protein OET90_01705 [Desulfuromonadales bacterium]|nr:hypothetical protein [Desulfuromonadales bacterium]
MKKSKLIVLLIIWFLWSAGKSLDVFVRYSISTDYYIFNSNGLAPLFFIFVLSAFLLDSSAVYFLFNPRRQGFYFALAALATGAIETITAVILAIPNLAGVREAYAIGRELRGLSVREKAMDIIFTPEAMYSSLGVSLMLYALIAFFVVRKKAYFDNGFYDDEEYDEDEDI